MRIASGGIQHETNTFTNRPTRFEDFVRDSNCGPEISGGATIFERYRGTGAIHGGYISGAEAAGAELVPLLCSKAQPSGIVEQAAFDRLLEMFLQRLKQAGPVDGLLLDLHGAMVTEQHDDAEGAFLEAVRAAVGPEMPIVTTLDLHANITAKMAALSNVIIGFDTYPHVDMGERGHEAALLLARMIRGEVRPMQAYRQLPLLTMPPMQCTLREPMQSLMQRVFEMEREPGVLTATVSMGFPFADIADAGVSILVTTDGDRALADKKADELAQWLWDIRDDLQPKLTKIEDVIAFARQHPNDGLIVFADGSDNPGGGAPADGTVALRALIDSHFEGAVVGVLFDPETAAQAHAAGVGATINARIGAKCDRLHGEPVETPAYVKALCDGRFYYRGSMNHGVADNLGPTATLVVGGVEIVVSTQRRQTWDTELLKIAGVDPADRKLAVLKSAVHFRAHFGLIAAHIFDADTPGIHRPDFACFDYRKVRRPIYPLDRAVRFGRGDR